MQSLQENVQTEALRANVGQVGVEGKSTRAPQQTVWRREK
jgi:hypothetical protein